MAGGPILPNSAFPVTAGYVFPNIHVGAGSGSKHDEGLGVVASLSVNAVWRLRFLMPPTLPTGVCKLRLLALANATSGSAQVQPQWVMVAAGESPSGATLLDEGTSALAWSAG